MAASVDWLMVTIKWCSYEYVRLCRGGRYYCGAVAFARFNWFVVLIAVECALFCRAGSKWERDTYYCTLRYLRSGLPLFQNKSKSHPFVFRFPSSTFSSHTACHTCAIALLSTSNPFIQLSANITTQWIPYLESRTMVEVRWAIVLWGNVNNGAARYCFVVDVWFGIFYSILHVMWLIMFRVPHPLDIVQP